MGLLKGLPPNSLKLGEEGKMRSEPSQIVIDASVVFKWQFEDEEWLTQAITLLEDFYVRRIIKLIAPQLLIYEITNSVATATRQRRTTSEKAIDILNNLLNLGVELREVEPAFILELALKHKLSAYDAAYLALAEIENCDLWTGDKALYRMCKDKTSRVKWIGDYSTCS